MILESCGPYYKRCRLYLRRFLSFLKPWDVQSRGRRTSSESGAEPAAPWGIDLHVVRLLLGSEYGEQRALPVADVDAHLARPLQLPAERRSAGNAPATPATRFAALQRQVGLSGLEVDLLWLMLLPELVPDMLWLYRAIWGDAVQVNCSEDFLLHLLDLPEVVALGDARRAPRVGVEQVRERLAQHDVR